MLVITSKRELIDTLTERLNTLNRARSTSVAARRTKAERDRLDGAYAELALVRDILANAAIHILNTDVERSTFTLNTRRDAAIARATAHLP